MEENNETQTEVEESKDTGEGDKPSTTDVLEQQSKRIKELEKEREERVIEEAKKQLAGKAEGGKPEEEPKEETPKEYIDKNFAKFK